MAFKKEIRLLVYNKFNCRCAYCGNEIELKDMQIDHLVPQYLFAQSISNNVKVPTFLKHLTVDDVNHIDNLYPSCRVCNNWKSGMCLDLFRDELEKQTQRLNQYSSSYRIAKRYGQVDETIKPITFWFEKNNNGYAKLKKQLL